FSSRRRHTRSKRDWSSDVCSSDLSMFRSRTAVRPCLICRHAGWRVLSALPSIITIPKRKSSDSAKQWSHFCKRVGAHFEYRSHRSEEHTSELQSRFDLVCRLLLEK